MEYSNASSAERNNEKIEPTTPGTKPRKENIKIVDILSDTDEGELLDVSYMYNILPKYSLVCSSKYIMANRLLDSDSMMLYEEDIYLGVWLYLSNPLISFFGEYRLIISQTHSNGLIFLYGIIELARKDGTSLLARGVRELYMFHDHKGSRLSLS
ncbi:hypothetical protein JCGZ_19306 [Jatropha curcas]|uniref:Uncharacterized protein n=1 Tax=Jatropha curcas TaxID=180498 RepID=A0A067K018_JATCU|nr:hypothetical protein JCGZ_19306 [Jatropha curcas]